MPYNHTRQQVHNRGRAPIAFLDELVAWGRSADEAIFAQNSRSDIYSSVRNTLGPWEGIDHRRAVMLEVLRVLGGFESSWDWNEGIDRSNEDSDTPVEFEAGIFQVSANSMNFGADLRQLVQSRAGGTDPDTFQRAMKADHVLAMEYCARLLRYTTRHHGPIRNFHIHPWLRRDAVAEFQVLLGSIAPAGGVWPHADLLTDGIGLAPGDIDRPSREEIELRADRGVGTAGAPEASGEALLWVPWARRNEGGPMRTRGRYRRGYPEGAIVHFTAGRDDPRTDIRVGIENGYAYFTIAPNGDLYQNHPLDLWGSHAGQSRWPSLGEGVSQYLVGIEICASGKLRRLGPDQFRPWYNEPAYLAQSGRIPSPSADLRAHQVRYVNTEANCVAGWYEKYTDLQEAALRRLLRWLRDNNPRVFSYELVLGHDEVSPGRKNDPGGALSVTMPALRASLLASA